MLSTTALGATKPKPSRPPITTLGTLVRLPGVGGCLVDRSAARAGCKSVRALRGPAPFLGSEAIVISPDGKNVYVASSNSDAIAVFKRNARTGKLTQGAGATGCISTKGAGGCASAIGLEGPNSVAVSPDGRSVYATSLGSNAIDVFARNTAGGALTQGTGGAGCIANVATTGCTTGRALDGPDVVAVSPDGRNVYVGAFKGNSLAVFTRDPATGALAQAAGTSGCVAGTPIAGCAPGVALASPEGLAVSPDGANVYVAAALSSALDVFSRNSSTGTLTQAGGGAGCIVQAPLAGCTTGTRLGGADAVAVSPDGTDVYVTSVLSNSVTAFARAASTGELTQLNGTSACVLYVLAVGCSLGQALDAPEGLAVSPDGASVYATAFASGAIDVLDRSAESGALTQKPRRAGCLVAGLPQSCALGRGLLGASSIAVSPDGSYVYSAAFASNAVGVFKRVTKTVSRGQR
ncbi:MAG TPA: beta-propeller fold lactonase family protein [Solirubrobacteraceae bacterium]